MSCNQFRLWHRLALVILALSMSASAAWKEKVLYSFQSVPDGATPLGGVVFDKAGNLYGTTINGGSSSCHSVAQCGIVFQLAPPVKKGDPWTETILHIFQGNTNNDGASPAGGLIIDSAGNLYGTTAYGGTGNCVVLGILMGCGAVYEMSPPAKQGGQWKEKLLYSFPTAKQGFLPQGDLVFDRAGNLYGATEFGGGHGTTCDAFYQYCGAVFELSPPKTKGGKWKEKVLHGFRGGHDGAAPNGGLVLDRKGDLFGTTYIGGYNCPHNSGQGCGTVFELEPPTKEGGAWAEKMLYRFKAGTDGANPAAGVTLDKKGRLYGTSDAAIFRMTPPKAESGLWTQTILHQLKSDAYNPAGALIFDTNGNLYGTTENGASSGTVFRLDRPSGEGGKWTFAILHGFTRSPDGAQPGAKLIFDKHGNLYGTTLYGGTGSGCGFGGCGTVFEVSP